jgi:hypothetical protein
MRTLKLHIILLGAALVFIPHGHAQQPATTAAVSIDVLDPSGTAIPHAKIRLEPVPNSLPEKMETDDTGSLQLRLANGTYALFISAQGFTSVTQHIYITTAQMLNPVTQVLHVMLEVGHSSGPMSIYTADSLVIFPIPYHGPMKYSPAEFHALPHLTITVHNGHTNADESYSGVPLATLLAKLGVPLGKDLRGEALTAYVLASGTDGYTVLLSLAEVDPSFHAGQVLVADTRDGKPLTEDGPFRLIVSDDQRPSRWVHNLNSIILQIAH